jgi:hypothetical protein
VQSAAEALLRRLLGERDLDGILRALLAEAMASVGASEGTVYCWDGGSQELQPIGGRLTGSARLGEGVVGAAARERRTIVRGNEAAVALVRGDQLFGALRLQGPSALGQEQVRTFEELVDVAAQVVVWYEAIRLDGALLAARTAEHEVNNRLVATTAYAQLMLRDPTFPPHLRERADSIAKGAKEAALIVRKLRELADIQETRWGPDPELTTIDLQASRSRVD